MPTWGIRGHSLRSGSWERGSQQQPDTQRRCSSPLSWVTMIIMCVCHHDLSISMIKISEISPLDKSCCRKESQIHRVLVQPPHRQRWRQRHLFTKDNKFCFDNFLFWMLLQRKRETNITWTFIQQNQPWPTIFVMELLKGWVAKGLHFITGIEGLLVMMSENCSQNWYLVALLDNLCEDWYISTSREQRNIA